MPLPQPCERGWGPKSGNRAPGSVRGLRLVGHLHPEGHLAEALALGVQLVSLDELFGRSDVVSLHTPQLAETEGIITGRHFTMMKQGATFINTARAAVVRQDEMTQVAAARDTVAAAQDR